MTMPNPVLPETNDSSRPRRLARTSIIFGIVGLVLTAISLLYMCFLVVNTVGTINEPYVALVFIAPYIFMGLPILCVSLIGLASGRRGRRAATSPKEQALARWGLILNAIPLGVFAFCFLAAIAM